MLDEPFDVVVPLELEAGVWAEGLNAWFTKDGIVLDFVAKGIDQTLLTSRVRVPATASYEIRGAVDRVIGDYELQFGEIRRPRPRGEEC